jgi:hypothetical protein
MVPLHEFQLYLELLPYVTWEPFFDLIPEIEHTRSFGIWKGGDITASGAIQLPYYEKGPVMISFIKEVERLGLIVPFDWSHWDEGIQTLGDEHYNYHQFDLLAQCKIITLKMRADRFCEGILGNAFESGLILRILRAMNNNVALLHKRTLP